MSQQSFQEETMLSDQSKLLFLLFSFATCLSTIFTSSTFQTGEKGIGTLNPPLHSLCRAARSKAKSCLDAEDEKSSKPSGSGDSSESCKTLLSNANKCESAAAKAYRRINMGGCARDIQLVTICELEWCDGGGREMDDRARKDCNNECARVRKALKECENGHVKQYFERAGLKSDGTVAF